MYIPEGFGTVTPYMVTKNADKFIEFLKAAFNAKEVGRTTTPDGTMHMLKFEWDPPVDDQRS